MKEEVRELFKEVIAIAMDSGKDIKLEWKDYNSSNKILGGSLNNSEYSDNGVVLSIYAPSEAEEAEE